MTRLQLLSLLLAVGCATAQQTSDSEGWSRSRRQFPSADWVPLTQPCPTCRPLADPADLRPSLEDIGLVPPRPPITSRQVHGTGNFFPQSQPLLQQPQGVFPPPRPYSNFIHFNQFPQSNFFSQQQQAAFLPQTYLNNPQLLLNEDPQLLPLVNNPQVFQQQQQRQQQSQQLQQQQSNGSGEKKEESNQIRFKQDFLKNSQKPPVNIQLEQQALAQQKAPLTRLELPTNSAGQFLGLPSPQFTPFQQYQQSLSHSQPEQQDLLQVNLGDPFLSSGVGLPNNTDIQIPGLEKEEIQLLYVPVETLRQRGELQGHTIDDSRPSFPSNQPFQQNNQQSTGHFVTQAPNQFSSSGTLPPALSQSLPLREPPQQFSTEKPRTSAAPEKIVTIQPRPVSTVQQPSPTFSTRQPSRPTETRTPAPLLSSSPFSGNDHFSRVTDNSFPSSPTPPPAGQNFRFNNQAPRHRFNPPPTAAPTSTTLQPHQPPLSIYMGAEQGQIEITVADVLRVLKGASNIAVLDSFAPGNPRVFVGPANLNTPQGVGRFELPYLSNLDAAKIEQRSLPFFVAPLNFNTPEGYTKIPFPSPHVGSVVVATDFGRQPQREFSRQPQTDFGRQQQNDFGRQQQTDFGRQQQADFARQQQTDFGRQQSDFGRQQQQQQSDFGRQQQQQQNDFGRQQQQQQSDFGRQQQQPLDESANQEQTDFNRRPTVDESPLVEQLNSIEPDITTPIPELPTTTTPRPRGRRPYQTRGRKPAQHSRRVTLPPNDEDTSETNPETSKELYRDSQDEQKRTAPRRQRIRTTTEPLPDVAVTEKTIEIEAIPAQDAFTESHKTDFRQSLSERPEIPIPHLTQPMHPAVDFHQSQRVTEFVRNSFPTEFSPPPPPTESRAQRPVHQFEQFNQNQEINQNQEVQGIFEVPPPPVQSQEPPVIESNGDTGFSQPLNNQEQFISTEQAKSVTQQYDTTPDITEQEINIDTTRKLTTAPTAISSSTAPDNTEIVDDPDKFVEIPKRSRFNSANASAAKSSSTTAPGKTRSHIRPRPRNPPVYTTTANAAEDVSPVEPTGPAEELPSSPASETSRTQSKYHPNFNRSRKPLRTTTVRAETTTLQPARVHTMRPLRRTTPRNSVSTKRIRKPTTQPTPEAEDVSESDYSKKSSSSFTPSAASNEVYDEQPSAPAAAPKSRKQYYRRNKTTSTTEESSQDNMNPPSRGHHHRKGETDDPKIEESRQDEVSDYRAQAEDNEVRYTTLVPSGPTGSSDYDEEKKKEDDKKKASDPELNKKGRRRLRVRVQKRPQDNFEAAESQNHGTVNNLLVPSTSGKPSAPDLYRFSQAGEFDFDSSAKFIGTQLKGHVRNITAEILENTGSFSSPGTDEEVRHVTIANELTTFTPDLTEASTIGDELIVDQGDASDRKNSTEATTVRPEATKTVTEVPDTTETAEITTSEDTVVATTETEEAVTTLSPHKEQKKKTKVVRTSTTTQVSHETEICYKGKCIKTNSDNPDKALRRLVESRNFGDSSKTKT